MSTDITTFLNDLDAGVFSNKVGQGITEAVRGAINYDKKGQVVVTFDVEHIGNGSQVVVKHTVKVVSPTARGRFIDEDTTETPMHFNKDGSVTIFPAAQGDLFKAGTAGKETV